MIWEIHIIYNENLKELIIQFVNIIHYLDSFWFCCLVKISITIHVLFLQAEFLKFGDSLSKFIFEKFEILFTSILRMETQWFENVSVQNTLDYEFLSKIQNAGLYKNSIAWWLAQEFNQDLQNKIQQSFLCRKYVRYSKFYPVQPGYHAW